MMVTLDATFDGKAIVTDEPLGLPANTRVRVTVEDVTSTNSKTEFPPYSWLEVAANANLDGPTDLSENLDDYLYHGKPWPA